MSILEKIDNIIGQNKSRHSFFQLKHFVIGKELTHQGRLHACVRELDSRKSSLEAITLEIEEQKDLIELHEIELLEFKKMVENSVDSPKKRLEIRIRQTDRKIMSINNKLAELRIKFKGLTEEITFFITAFEQLCKIENIKEWDDPEVQLEYWNAKFLEELNTRFLLGLPVDTELVRTMSALPDESQAKSQLVHFIGSKAKQLKEIK